MDTRDKARQKAEIMLAFANGAEVEFYRDSVGEWKCAKAPQWDWTTNEYRIKVVPKVVKYYCYDRSGELFWFDNPNYGSFKRIPSEDKEVLMP